MIQIKAYLTDEQGEKVDRIIKDYGFRSRNDLGKCLLRVFLIEHAPQKDEFLCEVTRNLFKEPIDQRGVSDLPVETEIKISGN